MSSFFGYFTVSETVKHKQQYIQFAQTWKGNFCGLGTRIGNLQDTYIPQFSNFVPISYKTGCQVS